MSRASVVGNTTTVVMRTNLGCGWPLTIDHLSGKVFWSDYCTYRIESLDIDGANYSIVVDSNAQHFVLFSYGIAKYGNMLYWTQPTKIYSLNLKPGSSTTMLYTGSSSQPLRTLHVVHPSQQPSGKYWEGIQTLWFCDEEICIQLKDVFTEGNRLKHNYSTLNCINNCAMEYAAMASCQPNPGCTEWKVLLNEVRRFFNIAYKFLPEFSSSNSAGDEKFPPITTWYIICSDEYTFMWGLGIICTKQPSSCS